MKKEGHSTRAAPFKALRWKFRFASDHPLEDSFYWQASLRFPTWPIGLRPLQLGRRRKLQGGEEGLRVAASVVLRDLPLALVKDGKKGTVAELV